MALPPYTPPVSPEVVFKFKLAPYTPPVSPNVKIVFGADDENPFEDMKQSNFLIFLTM